MSQENEKKREGGGAFVERFLRKLFDQMGATVDRKLGRADARDPSSGLTTAQLVSRMKRLIDDRVRVDPKRGGRIAPHHLKLKIEWGKHAEALPEAIKELEAEVLAAAIDHINDARLRTLAPVEVETVVDIFTTGVSVDPTFGEFEEELRREDEAARLAIEGKAAPPKQDIKTTDVPVKARVAAGGATQEVTLRFKPGGRRLSVGRVTDNDLYINHRSVSKIHAALWMNRDGTILVSDTGSTNGTFINGRRINYGETRPLEDGDVLGFGDVEVRLKK